MSKGGGGVRVGAGAGFAEDRIEPAVDLVERGELDFLVFECLAERTIALAQLERRRNPTAGFDPLLRERMTAVLAASIERGVRIVTSGGAANTRGAAALVADIARDAGVHVRIAAVLGDDVLALVDEPDAVSANAYLGSDGIVTALDGGADVVVTGRVADASLFAAPIIHAHGWSLDDLDRVADALTIGHLLECAGQVTGGYFADPHFKDVENLARLGFPIGEVGEDGSLVITKVEGSGGAVTAQTCKEQLLYEVHDPVRYLQPDVTADFSQVTIEEVGKDRVRISGGRGSERPATLKVSVGYVDSFIGEGQMSYAGPGALARGRLALEIVRERLKLTGVAASELRFDLIGVDSLHGAQVSSHANEPYEVRVRVTGRTDNLREAVRIGNEVETLYTNGPAGGGGAFKSARDVVGVASVLLPRELAQPVVQFIEGK
jgi:acyclic terpene utilization AtuA family protein